jgi:pimeloyl-ACP methyl ester carboxylesterase
MAPPGARCHRGTRYADTSSFCFTGYPQLTEAQLSRIRCPSLLISGEHDPFAGEAKIRHLSSLIQGSQYLVIPGGGHRPQMLRESPVLVNDAILHFIDTDRFVENGDGCRVK